MDAQTKGKIIDPVKLKTVVVTAQEATINFEPQTLMRYQARSLTTYISAGPHSYFMDDLSNIKNILPIPFSSLWGNTVFQLVQNPQSVCMFLSGNSSDNTQVIPISSLNRMAYIDEGEAYSYMASRSESPNYGNIMVSNNELYVHIERSDLDGFDYPEFSMRGTRKIPKEDDKIDELCGPISFTGASYDRLNYNWAFGSNAAINFNPIKSGFTPYSLTGSVISQEGCASISDKEGRLLFYTDGVTVYTKKGTIMTFGTGLSSSGTSTQSAIIVPQPDSDIYYIFTTDYAENPNGFEYSVVDMTLAGGEGIVTSKNNTLISLPLSEKVTACNHINGVDYWIITHTSGDSRFFAYKLKASGLVMPIITSIGHTHNTARGYMKTSPDTTKLISVLYDEDIIDIFDFDASGGTISNFATITGATYDVGPYGLEFSTDSSKFYISDGAATKIYQYDLTYTSTTEMIEHVIELPPISGASLGALQMGPDEKIYAADLGAPYLHVIHHPNGLGVDCNLQPKDFVLTSTTVTGITSEWGLPNVITNHAVSCDRYIYVSPANQGRFDFELTVNDVNDLVREKQLNFNGVIYRYDSTEKEFNDEVYNFSVTYNNINVESASTINIPLIDIGETEFIIKGYWEYPIQTLLSKQLGYRKNTRTTYEKGELYGLYTPKTDWYFLHMIEADKPFFRNNVGGDDSGVNGLVVVSQFTTSGVTAYTIDTTTDPIVTYNGSVLFKGIEYSAVTDNGNPMVLLNFSPLPNQVLTMAYIKDGIPQDLYTDAYQITAPVKSGATDQQLESDKVYFNTTYGTYEYYLDIAPVSDVVFSVNGSVLASEIEYVLSSSNPRRIILVDDVLREPYSIVAFYTPTNPIIGLLNNNNPSITWSINNAPVNTEGIFTVQFADISDPDFNNILYEGVLNYVVGESSYNKNMALNNAQAGDHLLYRIKNEKIYVPIAGETIVSVTYSDTVEIEIGTNTGINY